MALDLMIKKDFVERGNNLEKHGQDTELITELENILQATENLFRNVRVRFAQTENPKSILRGADIMHLAATIHYLIGLIYTLIEHSRDETQKILATCKQLIKGIGNLLNNTMFTGTYCNDVKLQAARERIIKEAENKGETYLPSAYGASLTAQRALKNKLLAPNKKVQEGLEKSLMNLVQGTLQRNCPEYPHSTNLEQITGSVEEDESFRTVLKRADEYIERYSQGEEDLIFPRKMIWDMGNFSHNARVLGRAYLNTEGGARKYKDLVLKSLLIAEKMGELHRCKYTNEQEEFGAQFVLCANATEAAAELKDQKSFNRTMPWLHKLHNAHIKDDRKREFLTQEIKKLNELAELAGLTPIPLKDESVE